MEFTKEKAVDSDGVSREAYSAFWENFLENSVRGKMNEYPDYNQTIRRRNGKLLEECG